MTMKGSETFILCACCVRLNYPEEEREQTRQSKEIDKWLEKEKSKMKREVKILLLGAGESGKSTVLKQMKIIHGQSFTREELEEYLSIIYKNIVGGMRVLIDARQKLDIPWENNDNEMLSLKFFRFLPAMNLDTLSFIDYVPSIRNLWQDESIQKTFRRRREFQLADSVRYFFENIDRISDKMYVPTNQDILHARKATKGITEFVIPIQKVPFRFVDVGGQRSQRAKWLKCFDNITSIMFLVSSCEYDQVLVEDRTTPRLTESLTIFDTIINHPAFSRISVILFLNKMDLLKEKVERGDSLISEYCPDFKGDDKALLDVQEYIRSKFFDKRRKNKPDLFHHFTTAVDTNNIRYVFNDVRETILRYNLGELFVQ
ncbi:guanine nucleotide-binding protein subunit alpha-13-like [Artemia franciscana]|uniref:Uncharacterized protein n=1 Tax=Artemia franciscana TaxID=6661 RepID=A0AA88H9Q4_ARTSF|nr:hypothetical protein QYM36_015635 [Artemia franciscana]